jgi:amino acid transporter
MSNQLKRNAIGTAGIVFFVVAAAAPLAATLGASPLVFGATGVGGPGAYLAAMVVLLLFAVGYATMSRHLTSAGGFAAYISRGLGRPWGFAAAFVALLAYNAMLAGIFGQLGAFAHDILRDQLHIDLPWQAWIAIGLAVVAILGYRDVQISARVLGVLLICEVLILLLLDVVIVGDGGDSGLSLAGFEPAKVFGGAAGVAVTFAFSCFVGFEATTIYGEEARDPKRTVPRATYVAILAIGVFYTVTMWAIGAGYGSGAVEKAAHDNPVAFVLDLNTRYVGSTATDAMNLLVITSLFASDGAPYVASAVQSCTTTLIVGLFAIFGADPFLNLFAWLVGLGTLGVLVLQAAASAAVIVFFRRTRVDTRPWQTVIAPLLGLAGLVTAIYLVVHNFDVLTGATSGAVPLLPWLVPLAALAGFAVWAAMRERGIDLGGAPSAPPEPAPAPEPAALVS